MNSYEIVKRAIKFEGTKRIPFNFENIGYTDFAIVNYTSQSKRISESEETDEWDCIWKKWEDKGLMGEPVGYPLGDWDSLKRYKWPDPNDPCRYTGIEEKLRKAGDKFVLAGIDGILRRARFLRGFSNLMEDFYLQPDKIHELLERLLDFSLRILHHYSNFKGIHGISMPEDWGIQTQPFLKTPIFREFFTPIYKKLFDVVHSYGWIFRMHSDGKINDLIEEFIDYGLDVIELEQPRALGIEEIGERYRGRICFEASIDIQATLPKGDRESIREEAKELLQNWATSKGGFIAVCYHGSDIGVSDEVVRMAFEAFQEFGDKFQHQKGQ